MLCIHTLDEEESKMKFHFDLNVSGLFNISICCECERRMFEWALYSEIIRCLFLCEVEMLIEVGDFYYYYAKKSFF